MENFIFCAVYYYLQILLLSKRLQTKKETDQNQPNQQLHVQS